jgi:hypothetical protein
MSRALSTELTGPKTFGVCQACGGPNANPWQEHNDADGPTMTIVFLCKECADRIIDPHPRLYRPIAAGEPFPAAMPTCERCVNRDGVVCRHPDLKANGGDGLGMDFPTPAFVHVDGVRLGKRFSENRKVYNGPVSCRGFQTYPDNENPDA